MENDHKWTKQKARYRGWHQSFSTARNALDEIKSMRMIQKAQVRYVGKNVIKRNNFVCSFFGLAA